MDKSTETRRNHPVSDDMRKNDTMDDNGKKGQQKLRSGDWHAFGPWMIKNNGDGTGLMKWRDDSVGGKK